MEFERIEESIGQTVNQRMRLPGRSVRACSSHWLVGLLQVVGLLSYVSFVAAQEAGSSHPANRQEALRAIPFHALQRDLAHQIHQVVQNPSVYRRLPVRDVRCDHELLTFLVRNPDIVVGMWQRIGITQLKIDRHGPYRFSSFDGMGTSSQFQLVYGTPTLHLFYGSGYYEGTLLKQRIRGQYVALLRSSVVPDSARPTHILNALDVFVAIEHGAADLAAKTLQPMLTKTADENFVITAEFVSQVSELACRNPDGLSNLVSQLNGVDQQVRAEMIQIVDRVGQRDLLIRPASVDDRTRVLRHAFGDD